MGRIVGQLVGQPRHTADRPEAVDEADFMETAARVREPHMHETAHPAREAEIDARTLDRQEAQDYAWREPTNLDAPPPRPGYRQKWVRVQLRSESDNINWNNRFRQGWTPRDPATVPEVGRYYTVAPHNKRDVIMVGGSVLCEMPIQKIRAREQWIASENKKLDESITVGTDKVSREGMRAGLAPIVREDRLDTTVAGKRRPATLAD